MKHHTTTPVRPRPSVVSLCWFLFWLGVAGTLLYAASPPATRPGNDAVAQASTTRSIQDLEPGDQVLAHDFETGRVVPRTVLKVYKHFTHAWVDIDLGTEVITSTQLHRFWAESEHAWIDAVELAPGMTLHLQDGRSAEVQQVTVRELAEPETTYNLEVEGEHNYFVGEDGVLVHNGPPLDDPGYFVYVLKDKDGNIYYVGMSSETPEDVEYRHSQNHDRFDPETDKLEVKKRDLTYGEARRMEHEMIKKHKTYIGRPKTYRGNRQRGISYRNRNKYYPDGGYPCL